MKWSTQLNVLLGAVLTVSLAIGATASAESKTPSRTLKKPKASHNEKHVDLDAIELDSEANSEATPQPAPQPAPSTAEIVPSDTKAALATADLLEKKRDYASVIKMLKPHMDTLPRKGFMQLARAYRATGDMTNETHSLELVIAKNPKDYVAQTELGNAYLKAKRYDDANTAFQAARTLNPRYRPAYDGIWSLLERADSKYEARTLVLDMIKTFGPDAKTSSAVCRMYSGEDFMEKAVEACQTAISIDPKNPDNYVHLAQNLRDQDKKDEAQKLIEEAAKRFSKSEPVQTLAGEIRLSDKNFADAYRYFKQAKTDDPKSVRAQVGYAKSAVQMQKHKEAVEAFMNACHLDRKTGVDMRAAYLQLKKDKDPNAHLYESDLDACN